MKYFYSLSYWTYKVDHALNKYSIVPAEPEKIRDPKSLDIKKLKDQPLDRNTKDEENFKS